MNRQTAFTLIELLVVVAIIMLLAALLLPALKGARLSSKNTTFVSNLRQVNMAMHLYADENKDRFPMFRSPSGDFHWQWPMAKLLNDPTSKPGGNTVANMRRSLLHDPLDDTLRDWWGTSPVPVLNVAINGYSFGNEPGLEPWSITGCAWRQRSTIKHPSELMMLGPGSGALYSTEWGSAACMSTWNIWGGGGPVSIDNGMLPLSTRYRGGGSYALIDGHVEFKFKEWVYAEAVKDGWGQSRFMDSSQQAP